MTLGRYVLYEQATGRIVGIYAGPAAEVPLQLDLHPGLGALALTSPSIDPARHYVDVPAGRLMERPILPAVCSAEDVPADGVSDVTISGLPDPSVVTVRGRDYPVADGVFSYDTNLPGAVTFSIRSWPFQEAHIKVVFS